MHRFCGARGEGGTRSDVRYAFAPQLAQNSAPIEGEPHDEQHVMAMGCPVLESNLGGGSDIDGGSDSELYGGRVST